jgi:hypothetical protein
MDRRGKMTRSDRQMPDGQVRAFLREHAVAHVGTNDAEGWPYVVALMYVYEEGDLLYLHTGARGGHFQSNVDEHSGTKICVAVSAPGAWQRGTPTPFDSSLVYQSAVVFGQVRVYDGLDLDERKTWFFDRLLARLGDSRSNYSSGYPMLKQIVLYEVAMEIVTGKINIGLHQ